MINYLQKARQILTVFVLVSVMSSCGLDEITELDPDKIYLPNYEGGIALLIVNDTIRFRDFLDETIGDSSSYTIDENERILFSYELDSQNFSAGNEFIDIEDINNSQYIESPYPVTGVLPADVSIPIKRTIEFEFPSTKNEQIDSVYYNQGQFHFELNTSFPGTVNYKFSTGAFTLQNSKADSIIIESSLMKPSGAAAIIGEHDIDLDGYKTNLTSESGQNKFYVNIDASVELKAGDVLTGNEYLNVDLTISDPNFKYVFGYFEQDTFAISEERVDLDVFEDLGGSGIEFEGPTLSFDVNNSFGVPIRVNFGSVYATYEDKPDVYFQDNNGDPLVLNIDSPDTTQLGKSVNSLVSISPDNSNIRDILSGSPTQLIMSLDGYTNPEGHTDENGDVVTNFLWSSSGINVKAKVTIPLSVKIDGFEYETTNELGDMPDEARDTEELKLVINTVNELPFTGALDLYMLDAQGNTLDSVIMTGTSSLFEAPSSYDSDGKVTAPSEHSEEIVLDNDAIEALIDSDELKIVFRLDSYDSSSDNFVEVFADYEMILKIGLSGNVSYDLNGN